jgi:hypothetical protein
MVWDLLKGTFSNHPRKITVLIEAGTFEPHSLAPPQLPEAHYLYKGNGRNGVVTFVICRRGYKLGARQDGRRCTSLLVIPGLGGVKVLPTTDVLHEIVGCPASRNG